MSTPLEHDYIGLSSEVEKITASSSTSSTLTSTTDQENDKKKKIDNALNLKETELRLGLPGSESPERKGVVGVGSLGLLKTGFVPGAKRGFSDAIDGKWVFSGNGGSEADLGKGGALFSPRSTANGGKPLPLGGLENHTAQLQSAGSGATTSVKDCVHPLSPKALQEKKPQISAANNDQAPPAKAQVVGWPPIRSFRKNTMATNTTKNSDDAEGKSGAGCLYVKVSMDGAPYLRKVDLKIYSNYTELSSALEKMFTCFTIGQCSSHGATGRDGLSESRLMDLLHGSEYVLTYEDKDNDWMLVGDVPWEMFTDSCKRLRIMKGSEAIGLAPRAMEKCKNRI